jgi:excisionase family DNA binding protein
MLTVEEVARHAKLAPKTVRREIERGNLRAHKLAGRWRVDPEDCQAWIDRSTYTPERDETRSYVPANPACGSLSALRRIESEAA